MAENQNSSGLTLMARAGRAISRWSVGTAAAAAIVPTVLNTAAIAGPTGETVVIGDVTFTQNGDHWTITASDGAVIEYDSFNLSMDEIVTFFQPGMDARVFNHILGSMPSQIDGSIFSNGIVYFVNPAGVIFGPTSVINVGGIYAAAASLSNADFVAGRDSFTNAAGVVVNRGTIVGSRIHLLGKQVHNHGSLRADGGLVMMAAGNSFLISEEGSNVMIQVDGRNAMLGPSAGATTPGIGSQAAVLNTGWIDAGTGTAVLAAGDLYALAIHNLGSIIASGGSVHLSASDGLVLNDGSISASADGAAGSVIIRGPSVMNRGSVRADSEHGQAGYVELTSQNHTLLIAGSEVSAQGLGGNARGGEILIHSYDGYSLLTGSSSLDVSGGDRGGDGGFVEFSGRLINMHGRVHLGAKRGSEAGTLLLDPYDLRIVFEITGGDNGHEFNGDPFSGDGSLLAFDEGNDLDPGDYNVILAETIVALEGNIILEAINDLTLETNLVFTNNQTLEMRAGNDLMLDGFLITGLSALTLSADHGFSGFASDGVGDVNWDFDGIIDGLDSLTINGVNVTLDQLQFTNLGSSVSITALGDVSVLATMAFASSGTFTIDAVGGITLGSAVGNASSVVLTADSDGDNVGDVVLPFNGDLVFTGAFEASGENIILDAAVTSITAQGLNLEGNLVTGAAGDFKLDALGGVLSLGNLTATTATNVLLLGNSISVTGTISADVGNLSLTGAGSVGGSLLSAGNVITNGNLAVVGSVSAGGDLTSTGDLLSDGALLSGGAMSIDGDAQAGFDITAGTTLDITGTLSLTGGGVQSVEAGGMASFGGLISKGAGDLSLEAGLSGAGTLVLDGGAEATNGALFLKSDATVGGDLISNADLTLDNTITLTGDANQRIDSGGTLTIAQAINKALGDLTLDGTTGVDVDAAITLSDGAFSSEGGYFDNTGSAISANSITLTHQDGVTIGGALTATGAIDLNAGLSGAGDLDILAVDLNGPTIGLHAGDGIGGAGVAAVVKLAAGTTFTNTDTMVFEQDAAVDTSLIGLTQAKFTTALTTGLEIYSRDASVAINDGTLPAGLDFTVGAGTTIALNTGLNVNSLTTNSGGQTTVIGQVDSTGNIDVTGDSSIQAAMNATGLGSTMTFDGITTTTAAGVLTSNGDMTFTGGLATLGGAATSQDGGMTFEQAAVLNAAASAKNEMLFMDTVTVNAAGSAKSSDGGMTFTKAATINGVVSAKNEMLFMDTADVNTSIDTTGALTFEQAANISGNLVSGAKVHFQDTATFDGLVAQRVKGSSIDLDKGATKQTDLFNIDSLTLDTATATLGGAVVVQSGDFIATGNVDTDSGISAAAGKVDITGNLKATNDTSEVLVNAGTTINVGGIASAIDGGLRLDSGPGHSITTGGLESSGGGNITLDGPSTVSGDITVDGLLTVNGTLGLTRVGLQTISGVDGITVTQSITRTGGDLTVADTSGLLTMGGNLIGDAAITLRNTTLNNTIGANQTIDAAGVLTLNGIVNKGNGTLFLEGSEIAGSSTSVKSTGSGGVQFNGTTTLTEAAIEGGFVNLFGIANVKSVKSTVGDIVTSNSLTTTGDIIAAESLSVNGNLQAGNDVTAGKDVTVLTGGATIKGNLLATDGFVDVTGNLIAENDVTAGTHVFIRNGATVDGDILANNGSIDVTGELLAKGNVTAASGSIFIRTGATIDGNVEAGFELFNGGANKTLIKGTAQFGNLNSDSELEIVKTATGDSINAATTLDIGGNVDLNGKFETFGATTLGGTTVSASDLFFSTLQLLTLDGTGTQTLTATTGTFEAGVINAGKSVNLSGNTATNLFGNVTVTDGFLSISGPTTLFGSVTSIEASDSVTFNNTLGLNSSVIVESTTEKQVQFKGNVTGAGHTLTVNTSGNTQIDGTVNTGQLITDLGGTTTIAGGSVTTTGQQSYHDQVVLEADATLTSSEGQIRFAEGVGGDFGMTTSTKLGQDTVLDKAAVVGSWTANGAGRTVLNAGITASGDLTLNNQLVLNTGVTLAGDNISLLAGVDGAGQALTINGSQQTTLLGTIGLGSLTTDDVGTLNLGADVTTSEGFSLGESNVLLVGNTTLVDSNVTGLEIENSFSGLFSLEISSAGDLDVTGGTYTEITALSFMSAKDILIQAQLGTIGSRLGSLSIQSGDNTLPIALAKDDVNLAEAENPGQIILDTTEIFTTGDVTFNGNGHDFPTLVSTIGATGDLLISSTFGDFTMGQNEKLTVLGILNVDLNFGNGIGTTATVGDITSLGDMIITADAISIQARSNQFLLAENPPDSGSLEAGDDPDNGVDFVSGGNFVWSVTPTVTSGDKADARFGSRITGNDLYVKDDDLNGFLQQNFDGEIETGLLQLERGEVGPKGDVFFDLGSSGPTFTNVAEALAGALPRDTEVQEVPADTPLNMSELRLLQELFINAKLPDFEEYLSSVRIGVALYDDSDGLRDDFPGVTVNRLLNDKVRSVLEDFKKLAYLSDEEAVLAGNRDRRVIVKNQLSEARLAFTVVAEQSGDSSNEAFYEFLSQGRFADTVQFLSKLNDLLISVSELGLTEREFRISRERTLQQIRPDNINLDVLESLLELSQGMDTAGESSVVETEPVMESEDD